MTTTQYRPLGIILTAILLTPLLVTSVYAHGDANLEEAKTLIEQEVSCDELSEDEYEMIGEYFMNLMYPDEEVHNMMDDMMGGEGTPMLHNAHVRIAQKMYCEKQADNVLTLMGVRRNEQVQPPNTQQIPLPGPTMMGSWGFGWHASWVPMIFLLVIIFGIFMIFASLRHK